MEGRILNVGFISPFVEALTETQRRRRSRECEGWMMCKVRNVPCAAFVATRCSISMNSWTGWSNIAWIGETKNWKDSNVMSPRA